ncbi:uncharacterized protein LOC132645188 [Lycium barbarum]|uniref:uncharacterized protein LOC132645188 n=1 Tax=Lycium barbarum TaxID=112863 RepID=UPI00293EE960|nr:uncharacterized protein LOC132645188 [Lycium barbarum]XP_060217994.1 uncharacterized protein LOC132645188 [Lycium barbarum]XP_060217995.1 uncharacterized protein LOC132645188 [Lycium barbarum]XP_060217996.1 uncharacterized protein LOC132645188 [Lycium barbarum]XP_060217997.1 uncharacterized protein LOC132645188 [Lycium barbarum]XP_060217998.1 uncharacterized protein LOC132645188 [Lycium barbarum]XP_060217999.1 uncharacterized protein LOC132645188 [Lycium barbarum]XP_060218000.1 uncharacte
MDFSEEWKSLWPISSSYSPPLLLSNSHQQQQEPSSKRARINNDTPIGPLFFKPCQETLKLLLNSPLLSTKLPHPIPDFSLPRFLQTNSTTLPSTSSSIATQLNPNVNDTIHNFNAIQLLPLPSFGGNKKPFSVLGICPTGENYDQVGFFILCNEDTQFVVKKFKNGASFIVDKHKLIFRILRLLVNPVSGIDESCSSGGYVTFGYLLVCTLYSVHWYSVKIRVKGVESVMLDYLGSNDRYLFKGCSVSHACWSPHLREECVVLLENGDLFLFDMEKTRALFACDVLQGKKLRVLWDKLDRDEQWLSCEFSWHPRILIVANSRAVFLVDLRSDKCKVCTLLKIEDVSLGRTDSFLALSRVESDPFCFTVISGRLLLLCDVRKPLMPLLRWVHGLNNPGYVTVLRLSDMRRGSRYDEWGWATESGRCILVGSFWDCEFALFCYGPGDNRSRKLPEISRLSKSVYAWGQPSGFSLSGRDCCCESCLMRADYYKDILPDWIDWRQKKVIVLGFGILNRGLYIGSDDTDSSVGFFLVRLMSCGSVEAQRYTAAWDSEVKSEAPYGGNSLCSENNLLYDMSVEELKFEKKYNYLGLDFLKEYLNGELTKSLSRKNIDNQQDSDENRTEFHQQICQKLKECGITRLRSSLTVSDVIKGISLPASIYEIALESISTSLPNNLLGFAFSAFLRFPELPLKLKKGSLEFSDILDKLYPLPFPLHKCCIDETPDKVQPCSSSTPILPPPFLVALKNLQIAERDILPLDAEMRLQSDKVMKVAREIGLSHSGIEPGDGYAVSLDADTECQPLCLHEPVSFSDCDISKMDSVGVEPDKRFTTFIYKKHQTPISNAGKEMTGVELFDEGCPVELKFNDSLTMMGANELETFKKLKQKDLDFQKNFKLYQEYLSGCHMWKQGP